MTTPGEELLADGIQARRRSSGQAPPTHETWVFVDDLDAHLARAWAAVAKIVRGIHQTGFRAYTAEDLEGHRWTLARPGHGNSDRGLSSSTWFPSWRLLPGDRQMMCDDSGRPVSNSAEPVTKTSRLDAADTVRRSSRRDPESAS